MLIHYRYDNHTNMRYCRESGKRWIIIGINKLCYDDRIDSFTDSVCNATQTIIPLLTLICFYAARHNMTNGTPNDKMLIQNNIIPQD